MLEHLLPALAQAIAFFMLAVAFGAAFMSWGSALGVLILQPYDASRRLKIACAVWALVLPILIITVLIAAQS